MREDLPKLLHDFAADRLPEESKRMLAEAAMADQEVFDAVLQEQLIKDLTEQPGALQALATEPRTASPESGMRAVLRKTREKVRELLAFPLSEQGPDLTPEPVYGLTAKREHEHSVNVKGSIVAVSENMVTVDIGAASGVCVGDHLTVHRQNDEIGVVVLRTVDQQYAAGRFMGDEAVIVGDTVTRTYS